MKVIDTPFEEVKIIVPDIFGDERGFFVESFNNRTFKRLLGKEIFFVQDNMSKSKAGVLRGLHYQVGSYQQAKLVSVMRGEVYDVVVDIRCKSSSFGKYFGTILSEQNRKQLWIPEGFAHGFYVISDGADYFYKVTAHYSKDHERSIVWNDLDLAIKWPEGNKFLSAKDASAPLFVAADYL